LPIAAGGASGATAGAPAAAVRSFFVATAVLVTALRFFFAVFLPADFIFRARIAFFCIELRFVGMGIFLSRSNMWLSPSAQVGQAMNQDQDTIVERPRRLQTTLEMLPSP
jgi:hypothetical protein